MVVLIIFSVKTDKKMYTIGTFCVGNKLCTGEERKTSSTHFVNRLPIAFDFCERNEIYLRVDQILVETPAGRRIPSMAILSNMVSPSPCGSDYERLLAIFGQKGNFQPMNVLARSGRYLEVEIQIRSPDMKKLIDSDILTSVMMNISILSEANISVYP